MKNVTDRFIFLLLFCCYSRIEAFRKCCEDGEQLSDDGTTCITGDGVNTIKTLAASSGFSILDVKDSIGFPTGCTKKETLQFSQQFSVSDSGDLRTPKYRNTFTVDKYCIDVSQDKIVAVICDQCDGKLCISLCCPFGYTLKETGYYDYEAFYDNSTDYLDYSALEEQLPIDASPCEQIDSGVQSVKLKVYDNDKELIWEEGKDFVLVGPTDISDPTIEHEIFSCPIDEVTQLPAYWLEIEPHVERKLKLSSEGVLTGVLSHLHFGKNETKFVDVSLDNYCTSFSKGETDIASVKYGHCKYEKPPSQCEEVRRITFNICFILSIIFTTLAIAAHFIEPKLRDSVFGKISIMYLINLDLQYLIIVIQRFSDPVIGSTSCILFGYLLQYFYLSFFCWVNAMAFFFFYALENLRPKFMNDKNRLFVGMIIYAQGFPLLICIITAIVDAVRVGQNLSSSDSHYFPEMGEYVCYLGYASAGHTRPSYFSTPEFIYVQVYQLLIIISNIAMFVKTALYIVKTRNEARNMGAQQNQNKENFLILAKLFVYMVCVWILEIVTSAIAAEKGIDESCVVRFILDFPNACYGIIIFLVLVCSKPPILKNDNDYELANLTMTEHS